MDDRKPSGNNQILKEKMKIGISIVIEAVLIMLEIYVLTQMQDQLLIAGAMVIPMALTLYFLILSIINVSQYNKRMELERYEDLYNAQKASYLIVRKSFEELSKRLEDLEQALLPRVIGLFLFQRPARVLQTDPLHQIVNVLEMVVEGHAVDAAVLRKVVDRDLRQRLF